MGLVITSVALVLGLVAIYAWGGGKQKCHTLTLKSSPHPFFTDSPKPGNG